MATNDAFAAILDTNALRRLTPERTTTLLELERQSGVLAAFDAWTLLELLAGAANPDNPKLPAYRTGLEALCQRSLLCNGTLVQPFESQLYRYLFGEDPPHAQANIQDFADTAIEYIETPNPYAVPEIVETLKVAAETVARREAEFIQQMNDLRDKLIADAIASGRSVGSDLRQTLRSETCFQLQALAAVSAAHRTRGLPFPGELPDSLYADVARDFRSGFRCRAFVLEQIVCDGMNIADNANLAWDIEIAHNLAQGIHNSDLLVVTNDKVFLRTARLLEKPDSCFALEGYETFLAERAAP